MNSKKKILYYNTAFYIFINKNLKSAVKKDQQHNCKMKKTFFSSFFRIKISSRKGTISTTIVVVNNNNSI